MESSLEKKFIIDNNGAVLNIESTATFLGISTATVRNWVKSGFLRTIDANTKNFFQKQDIENVKLRIANGDLEKLSGRANKVNADKVFTPNEYIHDKVNLDALNCVVDFIKDNNIALLSAIFLVSLNLLKKEKILLEVDIHDIIEKNDLSIVNNEIGKEIKSWLSEIEAKNMKENFSYLLNCDIPKERDVLGFLYQSLLAEGEKSQSGSYYTPANIVDKIISEHVKKDSKVLDPCCGTGQFLLAFSDIIENPSNIYGIDSDDIAVKIARLNILIKFKDKDFIPNIVCKNTLSDIGNYDLFSSNNQNIKDFDVIATNPPWGAHFSSRDIERLKKIYPEIISLESFSYFLIKSLGLLRNGGTVSFILPESILNVKTHRDIRKIILKNFQVKKIVCLNRVFKNVFTSVYRLDIEKSENKDGNIQICKEDGEHYAKQSRWLNNRDFIFDIHANGVDTEIIDKIYRINHVTLENKADWALGIVTGNNKKFIVSEAKEGFEPIYKGKDVERFALKETPNYVQFIPEKFQQVALIEKYRAKEKLIYRFISKYLVFAYDNHQKLTLNSANIVIPQIPEYPMKVIAALLNSSLYQFVFQKKFSSIKVLRSHIEQMPLPLWDKKTFSEIVELVDGIIKGEDIFGKLDDYIMNKFELSQKEKNYIIKFNK
ncbi:MAG: N-6 DNA methylase [Candidatus Staskawiczbacteria bacterium]|nr:N-6 DNA methylase [Candidatus Staskawiczbacteria bacterium]